MNTVKIAPSVLSANFAEMGKEVAKIQAAGADLVHLDVMDGVFVPNITLGIKMVEDVRKITDLPLDAHLMIVHPERYVEKFAKAGADIITVHAEACGDTLAQTLTLIRQCGKKAGAVINPDTPASAVIPVLPLCDMVLVMSVFPGFGGQKFIADVLSKVQEIKCAAESLGKTIDIEIDGGIDPKTAPLAVQAGANVLVAGSAVFGASDCAAAISALRGTKNAQ